ncbi:MAG TPA: helix-turn-helix domain-containing protein, partial [Phycisphaerales bacterium]|nr:helix-turn-helix domain-containing protein [Phycisphaerales bacterium]
MGWQEASIVEQRFEFVTLAGAEGANVAELCRRFNVSRQTGYKWLARFRLQRKEGL